MKKIILILPILLTVSNVFAEQKYPELCSSLNRVIVLNNKGWDVKYLQVVLGAEGYGYLNATGLYDKKTAKSVSLFQKDNGIKQTGLVGKVTLQKMKDKWCGQVRLSETLDIWGRVKSITATPNEKPVMFRVKTFLANPTLVGLIGERAKKGLELLDPESWFLVFPNSNLFIVYSYERNKILLTGAPKDVVSNQLQTNANDTNKDLLLSKLKMLMSVPDEQPKIYEITDPSKLDQAFYSGSLAGDYLFVFSIAGKAIIYSPVRNMIINAGPVQYDTSSTVTTFNITNIQANANLNIGNILTLNWTLPDSYMNERYKVAIYFDTMDNCNNSSCARNTNIVTPILASAKQTTIFIPDTVGDVSGSKIILTPGKYYLRLTVYDTQNGGVEVTRTTLPVNILARTGYFN